MWESFHKLNVYIISNTGVFLGPFGWDGCAVVPCVALCTPGCYGLTGCGGVVPVVPVVEESARVGDVSAPRVEECHGRET